MKDSHGEDWPVLGICQGLEVISVILGGDHIETLDKVVIVGPRPIKWVVNPQHTTVYKSFPRYLTDKMETKEYALHLHGFSVSLETF